MHVNQRCVLKLVTRLRFLHNVTVTIFNGRWIQLSISIDLKAIHINGAKKNSSVFIGKNSIVYTSFRKSQEGLATSMGNNSFHHCSVYLSDDDAIDMVVYNKPGKKPIQRRRVRKKRGGNAKRKRKRQTPKMRAKI